MPRGSGSKRERQYEHIKESAEERGASTGRAKEMAARTVNKERARSGETKGSGRGSAGSKSAGSKAKGGGQRSGGQRSGGQGSGEATYDQLYQEAKRRDVQGRSGMNKSQLQRALGK